MAMRPAVMYTPFATSLRHQNCNIINFKQFEEENILTKTRNNAESSDESDEDSIMLPLIREEEMEAMDSGDESDHVLISTEMSENICDGSQTHPNINRRETRYKICNCIRQRQSEW